MGLDIKIPIGAMFALLGIILTIFGLSTSGNEMYDISLDININLWSGILMFLFGSLMLAFSDLFRKKKGNQ